MNIAIPQQEVPTSSQPTIHLEALVAILGTVQDEAGAVWVPLRRPCEALGIRHQRQWAKLKRCPWATIKIILMVGEDGKQRKQLCLALRSVPGWLFSIHAGKIRPEMRAKLICYQLEAAEVLATHFFGPRSTGGTGITAQELQAFQAAMTEMAVCANSARR